MIFVFACFICANAPAHPQALRLERVGDHLRVAAPQFHFLSGKAAEKLRNGSTVTFVLTMVIWPEHGRRIPLLRQDSFVVSFDLWEEKYSVAQKRPDGKSASRLSAAAAEDWCLENMAIPVHSIPERQSFMVRLECSVEENEKSDIGDNHSAITLASLIDVFSRRKEAAPIHWEVSAGPFRIEQLKNAK